MFDLDIDYGKEIKDEERIIPGTIHLRTLASIISITLMLLAAAYLV